MNCVKHDLCRRKHEISKATAQVPILELPINTIQTVISWRGERREPAQSIVVWSSNSATRSGHFHAQPQPSSALSWASATISTHCWSHGREYVAPKLVIYDIQEDKMDGVSPSIEILEGSHYKWKMKVASRGLATSNYGNLLVFRSSKTEEGPQLYEVLYSAQYKGEEQKVNFVADGFSYLLQTTLGQHLVLASKSKDLDNIDMTTNSWWSHIKGDISWKHPLSWAEKSKERLSW